MKTQTQIAITPAPANLTKYTHANLSTYEADSLAAAIMEIEETGAIVLQANGTRCAVPTSYRSAYKCRAPHWIYDGTTIRAVDSTLENRPRGRSIPQHFIITGDTVPPGFRCFKHDRDAGRFLIRRK